MRAGAHREQVTPHQSRRQGELLGTMAYCLTAGRLKADLRDTTSLYAIILVYLIEKMRVYACTILNFARNQ